MNRFIENKKGIPSESKDSPFSLLPIMRRYVNLTCIEYTLLSRLVLVLDQYLLIIHFYKKTFQQYMKSLFIVLSKEYIFKKEEPITPTLYILRHRFF